MSSVELPASSWESIAFRLALALASGGMIGWERFSKGKAAGLRTHMLVSLGAALFVMTALVESPEAASRVVQGVAAGVGFLGGGEILHIARQTAEGQKIKGLTSAAATWVAAALGICAGYGIWRLVVVGGAMTLGVLTVAKWLEDRIPNGRGGDGAA